MPAADLLRLLCVTPFQPFRLQAGAEAFVIADPRQVAVAPHGKIVVILPDASRMIPVPMDELLVGEMLAAGETSLAPELPAYLLEAARSVAGIGVEEHPATPASETASPAAGSTRGDAGRVEFSAGTLDGGIHVVHAIVSDEQGRICFDTTGTRWSAHGMESFENGTSLYLSHVDDPEDEQRVILWPGRNGTFDTFAEAVSFDRLHSELLARDTRLRRRKARSHEPAKSWFRAIAMHWEDPLEDPRSEALAREREIEDEGRYKLALDAFEAGPNEWVKNPRILDTRLGGEVFSLAGSPWDFEIGTVHSDIVWSFSLQCWPFADRELNLTVDLRRRTARLGDDQRELPMGFVERHLLNFAYYTSWQAMERGLRAGPHAGTQPDVTFSLAAGFTAEFWAGTRVQGVPFLQPCVRGPDGRPLLDLRATAWAARLSGGDERPVIALRLVSDERKGACDAAGHEIHVDLRARRVVIPGMEGSTSLGMFQAMMRRVRGSKWMNEALPELLHKGRGLPAPVVQV